MLGMFPTLWPFGIGGFEDPSRIKTIAFKAQANYYFDIPDRSFRSHRPFSFIVLNILQWRAAHLHTHFTVRKPNFESVATELLKITPDILLSTARHLEHEGRGCDLDDEQRKTFDLLQQVNTIAARIPGSQASKIFVRNEIRSYFGDFGIPHLYFTANPSAAHSPIFQVMCGDQIVDLTKQFPHLVPSQERAIRLANDPVAATDFFYFSIRCIFDFLFGWDYERKMFQKGGWYPGPLESLLWSA